VLRLSDEVHERMVAEAFERYPLEACGLLAGDPGRGLVTEFYPCTNTTRSARIYALDPKEHLRAELDAEDRGLEIVGVMHSHTHTEAYPSPTDVAQAGETDPLGYLHYVIVSLKHESASVRSYRIADGAIDEEPMTLQS
jgi:[CysO sulfur-carrier protein]-S-L-cysteine hydrolase